MSKNKDTQLIWENYQKTLNESEEFPFDKLVHMGSEHYEKHKGSGEREDIYKEIEDTFLTFFIKNKRWSAFALSHLMTVNEWILAGASLLLTNIVNPLSQIKLSRL